MGLFDWPLQISNLDGDKSSEIEAMVDTGAIFTMLPGSLLREIGISPTRKDIFELADGSRAEMEIGEMRVRSNGYSAVTPVIFGRKDATPLIGAVTLEELLLVVDPVGQRLIPRNLAWHGHPS